MVKKIELKLKHELGSILDWKVHAGTQSPVIYNTTFSGLSLCHLVH
jgi:hypothetical protein